MCPAQTPEADSSAVLPDTCVMICTKDRPGLLAGAVASVLAGDRLPAEIVILDQSAERTTRPEWTQPSNGCRIRYLWRPGSGVARARNEALVASEARLLAVTDDDVVVSPSWFRHLIQALEAAGQDAVVTGAVWPAEQPVRGRVPSTITDPEPAVYREPSDRDVLFTNNMAMSREVPRRVGLFDERLGPGGRWPNAEDNDYGFRLLAQGHRILYVPDAVVYHHGARAGRALVRLRWKYGSGQGGFYAKHLSDERMRRRVRRELRARFVRLARNIVRPRAALLDSVYLAGVLTGMATWLLTQPRDRGRGPRPPCAG
jgi:GT2 family glycosyltransferase